MGVQISVVVVAEGNIGEIDAVEEVHELFPYPLTLLLPALEEIVLHLDVALGLVLGADLGLVREEVGAEDVERLDTPAQHLGVRHVGRVGSELTPLLGEDPLDLRVGQPLLRRLAVTRPRDGRSPFAAGDAAEPHHLIRIGVVGDRLPLGGGALVGALARLLPPSTGAETTGHVKIGPRRGIWQLDRWRRAAALPSPSDLFLLFVGVRSGCDFDSNLTFFYYFFLFFEELDLDFYLLTCHVRGHLK